MPFPMKIQPIDFCMSREDATRFEAVKPMAKSRVKCPFTNVLSSSAATESASRSSISTRTASAVGQVSSSRACCAWRRWSRVSWRRATRSNWLWRQNCCNYFNGNCNDSSEDEFEAFGQIFLFLPKFSFFCPNFGTREKKQGLGCDNGGLWMKGRVIDEFLNLPLLLTENLTEFDGMTNGATQQPIE
ncbi:unnamed protein product [Prunus armeniaca]|uniref:Uncharacterized protein n=1 Tax=Prunus armeniaca TaxID=36596 RepID=A0A6J5U3Z5_PRUAR|nr:unnamed protein product [Prunus armeniaca]CAB4300726.1 unnamed protein product [Prunus armeniaca]